MNLACAFSPVNFSGWSMNVKMPSRHQNQHSPPHNSKIQSNFLSFSSWAKTAWALLIMNHECGVSVRAKMSEKSRNYHQVTPLIVLSESESHRKRSRQFEFSVHDQLTGTISTNNCAFLETKLTTFYQFKTHTSTHIDSLHTYHTYARRHQYHKEPIWILRLPSLSPM